MKKDRDQKKLEDLIVAAVELAKLGGQAIVALGMHTAQMATGPKKAAVQLLTVGAQFHVVGDGVEDLANKIIDWDANRLITKVDKPLVDADGKPLA